MWSFTGASESKKAGRSQTRVLALIFDWLSANDSTKHAHKHFSLAPKFIRKEPKTSTTKEIHTFNIATMATEPNQIDRAAVFKQLDEYPWDTDRVFQVCLHHSEAIIVSLGISTSFYHSWY